MTENEMLDFLTLHVANVNEMTREQMLECWGSIVQKGEALAQSASHIVVPEGGIDPQTMLDEIMKKLKKRGYL